MLRLDIGEKRLLVTTTVLSIFRQFYELAESEEENGGIVLGQFSKRKRQVLVCRASAPGDLDRKIEKSFRRNRRAAQQIIEYEFYNSAGRNTYLGEWHTHPAPRAVPSREDIHMIEEQFATNEMMTDFLLLFIVAQRELFTGLYDGRRMLSGTTVDYLDCLV